ncbi:hypothetical protein GXW82_20350 [Streptacidiphilus sp. 4-A2]|nr:hypothetical protein [Streptacidiphilus sp. 4-A2]
MTTLRAPRLRQRATPSSRSGSPPSKATSTHRCRPNWRTSRAIRKSSASSKGPAAGAVISSAESGPAAGSRAAAARSQPTRCSPVPKGSVSTIRPGPAVPASQLRPRAVSATSRGSRPSVTGTTQTGCPGGPGRARASSTASVSARPVSTARNACPPTTQGSRC